MIMSKWRCYQLVRVISNYTVIFNFGSNASEEQIFLIAYLRKSCFTA